MFTSVALLQVLAAAGAEPQEGPVLLRAAGKGPDPVERTRESLEAAVRAQFETLPTLPYAPPPRRLDSERADFLVRAERIEQAWSYGDFPRAAQLALELDQVLDPSRSSWIQRAEDREALHKALVLGALAHQRLNHREKAQVKLRDALRRFPEQAITRAVHGPEALALAERSVLPEDQQAGLRIVPRPGGWQVYLNGAVLESDASTWTGLQPGLYRVHLADGSWTSRSFYVQANAGQVATVTWNPELDPRLDLSGPVPVIQLADPELAEGDRRLVQRLILEAGASAAVLTAAESGPGGWQLRAHRVLAPASDPTTQIRLDVPPKPSQVTAASRTLTGAEPMPDAALTQAAPPPPSRPKWPQWVMIGGGVAAAGVGAALVALDSPEEVDGVRQPEARNSAEAGAVLLGVGGGAALAGTLWLLLSDG